MSYFVIITTLFCSHYVIGSSLHLTCNNVTYGHYSYYVNISMTNQATAETKCKGMSADLVYFDNIHELGLVAGNIKHCKPKEYKLSVFWIDGIFIKNQWRWSHGSIIHKKYWCKGFPVSVPEFTKEVVLFCAENKVHCLMNSLQNVEGGFICKKKLK